MNALVLKLALLIEERNTVVALQNTGANFNFGVHTDIIKVNPGHAVFGTPMTILKSQLDDALTQYKLWLENQIKSVALEITEL